MVKVIGIAGSPRKNGNSTTLLSAVLRGAASAGAEGEIVRLNDLTYRGCQGCLRCAAKGMCILKDALTPVFAALRLADIWVLASPIYYDGVSGQMKTFFDRCRWLTWVEGEQKPRLAGRRRAAVLVAYADKARDDYRRTAEVLAGYLSWMGDFGKVDVMSAGELGPPGDAGGKRELIEDAEALGRRLAQEVRQSRR